MSASSVDNEIQKLKHYAKFRVYSSAVQESLRKSLGASGLMTWNAV